MNYALSMGLTRQGIPTKNIQNLSTGKVSYWKAKKYSTIKPTIKSIAGPRESKVCNYKEKLVSKMSCE